MDVQTTLVIF